jgi:transcriptional regulator with XRE-family HTH domain
VKFGETIERLRRDRGLTQENLAELSHLSPDTIKRVEKGQMSPSLHTQGKLALGFGMRLSEIFEEFERNQCDAG